MTRLFFCQNGVLLGRSFWQKDSLVTLILFELCLLWYLAQSQILGTTLYNFLWNRRYVPTYFITGSASTQKYTCIKENSDGSTTKTTFNFKRNQGNECEVEERIKNPNQQEFAKLSVNDCSWVPECYSAGPSKKFSLKF